MLIILYYCLKAIICSGLLFGYYLLALRNNRFHQWNRYYLLAAVILSFTLPFLKIQLPFFTGDDQPVLVQSFQIISAPDVYFLDLHQKTFAFTWPMIFTILYTGVALFFIVMFIKNIFKIQRLKRSYPEENLDGIHFYNTQEPGTPFSFFKNIFWNSTISLNNEKGQQMLRHEITHIQEKHSLDKVAMELLIAFAWWNPFLYYIRKELSVIHEFIADQKASAGDDNLQYASLLLMKAMGSEQYTLGNPFFHSQLKRRVTMLTTIKNPKFSYMRRLMVLPLAVIAIALFSFKYKPENKTNRTVQQKQLPTQSLHEQDTETPLAVHGFYEDTTRKKVVITKMKQRYKGTEIETVIPTDDLKGAVVKTTDGKTYFLDRKEVKDSLGITITDKGWAAPKEAQIIYYDRAKSTYYNDNHAGTKSLYSPLSDHGKIKYNDSANKPLYIIDGKEALDAEINTFDPNIIKSVEVWKDKKATDQYGKKGKNGVIIITTKSPAMPEAALYMIDDKEATKEQVEKLSQESIAAVDVWKGESAIEKFGEKGKNGVIKITTKKTGKEIAEAAIIEAIDKLQEVTVVGYKTEPNVVFTKAETPATFPGGSNGWMSYLKDQLRYPEAAQKTGTQGTIRVQITIEKDGSLSEVKALDNPGGGLAEEAVRVLKQGPKWNPAEQNGGKVANRLIQSITFKLGTPAT